MLRKIAVAAAWLIALAANGCFMFMWMIFGLAAAGREHQDVAVVIVAGALAGVATSLILSVQFFRRQKVVLAVLSTCLMTPLAFAICSLFI